MKAADEFLKAVKDDIESREVNLTRQQIQAIQSLEKIYDQPFENVVLLLINHGLQEIQESYINSRIRQHTIKN